jgi:hypothetical protein
VLQQQLLLPHVQERFLVDLRRKTVMMYHLYEHRPSLVPEKTELKFSSSPYTRLQSESSSLQACCLCIFQNMQVNSTLKPSHRLGSRITYKVFCKSTFSNRNCFRPHASKEMPFFPVKLGNTTCWPLYMLPASLSL